MPQSPPFPDIPLPRVISVAGLKHSGKTTVVEAVISGLVSRGFAVGSIKTMSDHLPSLSAEATDTRRHESAGAAVVVALHAGGTARFEPGRPSRSIRDVAQLFPARVRILVAEGSLEPPEDQLYIVCLRSPEKLAETLKTRHIPPEAVIAISGAAASPAGLEGVPFFDVTDSRQKEKLVELVLERIGSLEKGRP